MKNGLPGLPTWEFPQVKMYYPAQEANLMLQKMEQEFNKQRIIQKTYVEAVEKVLGEKDARISELEGILTGLGHNCHGGNFR